VLAEILRERFGINNALFGGLIAYAALTTIFPAIILRAPREAFEIDQEVVLAGAAPLYEDEPGPGAQ